MNQLKSSARIRGFLIVGILLGLALVSQGSVNSASVVQPIVLDDTINARSDIDYGNGVVAVTWAGDTIKGNKAIYIATKALADASFGSPLTVANNPAFSYFPPKIGMISDIPVIVWSEWDTNNVNPNIRNIREYTNGVTRMIAQNICSPYPDPDVVVGSTAVHVIFAATDNCSQATFTDLYYSKRLLSSSTWSTPVKIVDRNDANPAGYSDKIRYPRIAVNSSDTAIYAVWEQSINGRPSIWYTSSNGSTWTGASRISPIDASDDMAAVYPAVTVDGGGNPHFTWTELVPDVSGSITPPAYQNIFHRTFQRPNATQINFQRVYVTDNIPTHTISDVSAFGTYVCISWYSYDAFVTGSLEDVRVRCSNDAGIQSWSLTMNLSESEDWLSPYPSIVIDNHYDMHVSWAELEVLGLDYEPVGLYYNEQTATYDEPLAIYFPISLKAGTP